MRRRRRRRRSRHHALNDLVARAFASAAIPVAKEPQGLSRAGGKRPDGLTMVPWREGKPLTWDVTVVCPVAESYIGDSATNAGSAAEAAATRKAAKYAGTMNASVGLGQKILSISGDDRETCCLFQRISVLIQRFNATLLHESFIYTVFRKKWYMLFLNITSQLQARFSYNFH